MLAAGTELMEEVKFAGARLTYTLRSGPNAAAFDGQQISVTAALGNWTRSDEVGFYFVAEPGLKVSIEKDLECVDGPENERDPDAFPRAVKAC